MKIYIENLDVNTINPDVLYPYKCHEERKQTIYCESGIFKVSSNKLLKLKTIDMPLCRIKLNNVNIIIDKSEYKIVDEHYQIPLHHVYHDYTHTIYSIENKSRLKLVIVTDNNLVKDVYFETDIDIRSIGIKDDIFSFLSLIKFDKKI